MQKIKKILLLFIILKTFNFQNLIYKQKKTEHCSKLNPSIFEITSKSLAEKREKFSTPNSVDFKILKQSIESGDFMKILNTTIIMIFFVFFLFLFSLISIPIFVMNCCCSKNKGRSRKTKIYFFCFFFFLFLFLASFGIFVFFVNKLKDNYSIMNCVVAKIPNDLLNGFSENLEFIGFFPLKNLLTNFLSEIQNLNNANSSYDQIISQNLKTSASEILHSIDFFSKKYKFSETLDAIGNFTPNLITAKISEKINLLIDREFTKISEISENLEKSAFLAKNSDFTENLEVSKNLITQFLSTLEMLINPLDQNLSFLNEKLDFLMKFSPLFFWVILGLCVFLFLLYIFFMIVLYNQIYKNKCFKFSKFLRFFLVFVSFFVFIIALSNIAFMLVSLIISSYCDFSKEILSENDFGKFFGDFNIIMGEQEIQFFNECLPEKSEGDLVKILGISGFETVQELIDGFSGFQNFQENLEKIPDFSVSIEETSNFWAFVRDGIFPSHVNVYSELIKFNNLIKCDSQFFFLNDKNCTISQIDENNENSENLEYFKNLINYSTLPKIENSENLKNCQGINSSQNWTPPSCSSSESLKIHQNLQNSFQYNFEEIQKMINFLKIDNENPDFKYQILKQKLKNCENYFIDIKLNLEKTLNSISNFKSGFSKISNCKILRKEILDFEIGFCFEVRFRFFFVFVIMNLLNFFLVILNFCFCCTLKNSDRKKNGIMNFNPVLSFDDEFNNFAKIDKEKQKDINKKKEEDLRKDIDEIVLKGNGV